MTSKKQQSLELIAKELMGPNQVVIIEEGGL